MFNQDWGTSRTEPVFYHLPLPQGCIRQKAIYQRCLLANNEKKSKCIEEAQNILEICPTWVLDDMRVGKLQKEKELAIDNLMYREAMKVGAYNKGRTIANISNKTTEDASSAKLRPDTMWADDRYADITQAEINAARERNAQRKEAAAAKKQPKKVADFVTHDNFYRLSPEFDLYTYRPTPEDVAKAQHYDWVHAKKSADKPTYPSPS